MELLEDRPWKVPVMVWIARIFAGAYIPSLVARFAFHLSVNNPYFAIPCIMALVATCAYAYVAATKAYRNTGWGMVQIWGFVSFFELARIFFIGR